MKILVPLKRVPDPELKTKIKDGAIDLSGASWVVNPFDEYAVETALRLLENGDAGTREGGEVVVVTIGPSEAAQQVRSALAMGADRAIRVDAEDKAIDALTVVAVLQAIVAEVKPDLILMGKQAVDGDANQVGQMLAGKLGLPQATFAASIELAEDKASVLVGREVVPLYAFHLQLSHSRFGAVVWSRRKDQLAWLKCHNEALNRIGGVPATLRVDNEKTAVSRGAGAWGEVNPTYRRYAMIARFHVDACAPRSPQHKGKVERNVRCHRLGADPTGRAWTSLAELQAWTDEKMIAMATRRTCSWSTTPTSPGTWSRG